MSSHKPSSRASISTGDILLSSKVSARKAPSDLTPTNQNQSGPLNVAIIGNFSGQPSEGTHLRAISVDRDNFDDVFAAMNVNLTLEGIDQTLNFREMDDLHPDYLYEHLDIFSKFRTLKRRLNKPQLFEQAAEEILSWSDGSSTSQSKTLRAPEKIRPEADKAKKAATQMAPNEKRSENFLEEILNSATPSSQQSTSTFNIDRLIQQTVANYIEPKSDPRKEELLTAVDQATAKTLREVMHASGFQELESNWRSLYFLIRRLEDDRDLTLSIIDMSQEQVRADLTLSDADSDARDSSLYSLFVDNTQVPGEHGFSVLQFNQYIHQKKEDVELAAAIAKLAQCAGAVAVCGAHESIAGCLDISLDEDISEWPNKDWRDEEEEGFSPAWQQLRQSAEAKHLSMALPRFLLRMPYGKKSSPIEAFSFEELEQHNAHRLYLWGNGATLVTLIMCSAFLNTRWQLAIHNAQEIDDLPLHIYYEDDEAMAKPCAEVYMRESIAGELANTGCIVLRSVKGQAAIVVSSLRSLSVEETPITEAIKRL